jgi:hypothetical protein
MHPRSTNLPVRVNSRKCLADLPSHNTESRRRKRIGKPTEVVRTPRARMSSHQRASRRRYREMAHQTRTKGRTRPSYLLNLAAFALFSFHAWSRPSKGAMLRIPDSTSRQIKDRTMIRAALPVGQEIMGVAMARSKASATVPDSRSASVSAPFPLSGSK